MTLYVGQSDADVKPLEKEQGLMLFDERTRRAANSALHSGSISLQTKSDLERMYTDGSIQAQYFLGELIIKGVIEYPLPYNHPVLDHTSSTVEYPVDQPQRGSAGPGFGKLELGPYLNTQLRSGESERIDTLDLLGNKGIADLYTVIEQE